MTTKPAVAAVLLVATACTSHPAAKDPAAETCRRSFPGQRVAGAFATTVAAVRARTVGPGTKPAELAWPTRPATTRAAWCYLGEDGSRTVAAAVDGEAPVVFATGSFDPDPDGPKIP